MSTQKKSQNPPQPRAEILRISPYVQGKSQLGGHPDPVKLSSNESSFGPSPKAIEAYKSAAASLHRYPDGSQHQLRHAIAEVYDLDADKIICGNGSDELLDLIYRSYLSSGDEIILSNNHFVMCALYAQIQAAQIVFAKEDNYVTRVDDLLNKVTAKTRMVTLANPNNPTGTYLNKEQIRAIHQGLPSDVLFVIDGAYAEFVTADDFETGTSLVDEYDNVVVTRTFSKIYGMSSLRIGWAYCPLAIIEILQRIRSPFNTNGPALAMATEAVKDTDYLHDIKEHTARWQKRMQKEMDSLGIDIVPSVTNFYLLEFDRCQGKSASGAAAFLETDGIIPRLLRTSEGKDVLRITIGLDSENEAVIRSLTKYMS